MPATWGSPPPKKTTPPPPSAVEKMKEARNPEPKPKKD